MSSGARQESEMREDAPLLSKPKSQHHNLAGLSAWRFRIVLLSIWSLTFFVSLDGTLVATLLTPIGSYFNASNQAQWLGTSYLLSLCCFTPVYGRLSDLIGRKPALYIALTLFTAGIALCSVSNSMGTLIAARAISGMGGGGLQTMSIIIVTDIVDLRRRGLFQGYANIFWGLGGAMGGPVGGFISDRLGWRMAFTLQLPFLFTAALMVITQAKLPPVAKPASSQPEGSGAKSGPLARLDYLGSLTLVVAVGTLLLAVSLKTSSTKANGTDYFWSDPQIYGLLIASIVFVVAFILVEGFFAREPILPLGFIARRTPCAVGWQSLIVALTQFGVMYNIPLYCSTVLLQSASESGAHLLPYSILLGVGSLTAGYLMRRTGKYWWFSVSFSSLMVISAIMLSTWTPESPVWSFWVAQMPSALGYGAVLTTSLVALMTNVVRVGKGEVAVATSMTYMFRTVGQVLGVSLSAAVVQSIITHDLDQSISGPKKDEIIYLIRHSTSSIPQLDPLYRQAAVAAYQHALHIVFLWILGLSILNTLILTAIKEEAMPDQQKQISQETEQPEQSDP